MIGKLAKKIIDKKRGKGGELPGPGKGFAGKLKAAAEKRGGASRKRGAVSALSERVRKKRKDGEGGKL